MGDLLCLLEYDKQFREQKKKELSKINIYNLDEYTIFIYKYICELDSIDFFREITLF